MQIAAAEAALSDFLAQCEATGLWHRRHHSLITALSGGPDSLALALIAERVSTAQNIPHKALIIDHGLRQASAVEAATVQAQMRERGIAAEILTINSPKPAAGHQAWARHHRLDMLATHARRKQACVLFGHHGGDQQETIAMRLARGSGLHGLAGIAPLRFYKGALFARPFLSFDKKELIQLCRQLGGEYVTDPSNENTAFERVRWRQMLAGEGELPDRLARLSRASSVISGALDRAAEKWIKAHITHSAPLWAHIAYREFSALPEGHGIAIIAQMIKKIGHFEFAPFGGSIKTMLERVAEGRASTLAGCRFQIKQNHLIIEAEYGRKPAEIVEVCAGDRQFFDGRWMVKSTEEGRVCRLGDIPLSPKQRRALVLADGLSVLPYRLKRMIPVLQTLDDRLVTPHLKTDSVVAAGKGRVPVNCLKADAHPFMIWPAPPDGAVRLPSPQRNPE